MEINSSEMAEVAIRMNRATKSLPSGFAAMAHAAAEAMQEFQVACYPDVPSEDHPIVKQMRAVAESEGKRLVLTRYPRHIPDKVFGQSWIIYDEVHSLDWPRRVVVRRRGKTMVYRNEIRLP